GVSPTIFFNSQLVTLAYLRPEPIVEKVELTLLPRKVRIRITTIAMSTRIRAYSTRPWPFFLSSFNLLRISFLSLYEYDDNNDNLWLRVCLACCIVPSRFPNILRPLDLSNNSPLVPNETPFTRHLSTIKIKGLWS